MDHHNYRTKYRLDTAVAIIFILIGGSTVSVIFGMLLFAVFTHVCANELLVAAEKIGYGGIATLVVGLFLEAYNLYEHHRQHVAVVVAITMVMGVVVALLIHFFAQAYTCLQ